MTTKTLQLSGNMRVIPLNAEGVAEFTPLNILIVCECSGIVRQAFRRLGHNAWSNDLKPAEDDSPHHLQRDALSVVREGGPDAGRYDPWDLIIMHPPCTYLSVSGLHWNARRPERARKTEAALQFVQALIAVCGPTPYCLENPVGLIGTRIRPADQWVQPYEFGHNASKRTGLWLQGLPKLRCDPKDYIFPRMVASEWHMGHPVMNRPRWANQTDSGQNRLAPSEHRAADRARTYPGIARQMALQWSDFLYNHRG